MAPARSAAHGNHGGSFLKPWRFTMVVHFSSLIHSLVGLVALGVGFGWSSIVLSRTLKLLQERVPSHTCLWLPIINTSPQVVMIGSLPRLSLSASMRWGSSPLDGPLLRLGFRRRSVGVSHETRSSPTLACSPGLGISALSGGMRVLPAELCMKIHSCKNVHNCRLPAGGIFLDRRASISCMATIWILPSRPPCKILSRVIVLPFSLFHWLPSPSSAWRGFAGAALASLTRQDRPPRWPAAQT